MGRGRDAQRVGALQPGQEVIGLTEVIDRNRAGLAVDAFGLDDVPVSMAA